MKAYIQTDKNGDYFNVNAFVAFKGFEFLGWEICKFFDADEIEDNDPEIVVVGGIGNVRKRLANLGIQKNSPEIDYPEELQKYLGRKVWSSTLQEVFSKRTKLEYFHQTQRPNEKIYRKSCKTVQRLYWLSCS